MVNVFAFLSEAEPGERERDAAENCHGKEGQSSIPGI